MSKIMKNSERTKKDWLRIILIKIVGIKIYLLDILKKMHGEEKSLMNGRLTIKDNPIL